MSEETTSPEKSEAKYAGNPTAGEPQKEKVRVLAVDLIDDFPNHPFKVIDDDSMEKLKDSIRDIGVQSPIVARIKENGRYEVVSGHRRLHACKKLGIKFIPVIVRTLSLDEAIIAMVDANLQREHILPSEKAFAYKMKMEAMKRRAGRPMKENEAPVVPNYLIGKTTDLIGEENGESGEQVRRYIRLTELVPELMEMVDNDRIAFRPAVELSYLTEDEQRDLVETIDTEEATPSLAQAIQMKRLSQEGKLDMDKIFGLMSEEKPNQIEKIKIPTERFDKYFDRGTSPKEIERIIFLALDEYYARQRMRQRSHDAR